jgi:alanyl-tRNA synthetase
MRSADVRRTFLEFFRERGHQIVPSSPLILPADPTLLFANAGMNQFKEVFRGRESRPYTRAASSQKCLRVSGKHNDLEEVGRTPRHHTFFEMLGNFSFGDYFKHDAIVFAWQLVTEAWGLDPDRVHATVFAGDDEFPADEEAARLWREAVGLPAGRVGALGRKDNFWQMGDTGPAGPCSELHYDMDPSRPADETPENAPDRFLEIWNLVFMQYDLQEDGSHQDLPAPCVDTGAGLERLTAVLSGVESNYDTDLFQPIIQSLGREVALGYGEDPDKDVSLRVIADHLRAITMLVAEGVIPGPEKRGAVLRKVLRRALRHGRLLELPAPFLHRHVGDVVEILAPSYPELGEAREVIEKIVRREEERFERTLSDGFERLEASIDQLVAQDQRTFPGDEAFVLESERGLPLDLIRDALSERDLELDEEGYQAARAEHVKTSRVLKEDATSSPALARLAEWQGYGSHYAGHQALRVEATEVRAVLTMEGEALAEIEAGGAGQVILEQTPFYAEAGGQVGDRGQLSGDGVLARVETTRTPVAEVIVHHVVVERGSLRPGDLVTAEVDVEHRAGARRHHTATHLLHAALRRTLGPHVKQAGSLVAPDRLRFDFSHYEAIQRETLDEIEQQMNRGVLADLPVAPEEMELEEALDSGALAFFGDRYGSRVRVIRVGDVSAELCGGTHVTRTGEIGPCRIVYERGVAAGVRRIEAVVGVPALEAAHQDRKAVEALADRLGTTRDDIVDAVARRLESLRSMEKENEQLRLKLARGESQSQSQTADVDGVPVTVRRADGVSRSQRRDLADSLRQKSQAGVVVLGAEEDGKAALLVAVGAKAPESLDARELVRALGPMVGGGGGGRRDLAEAGGKNPAGVDDALSRVPEIVRQMLQQAAG